MKYFSKLDFSPTQKTEKALRAHPLGAKASLICTVYEDDHHFVQRETAFGDRRVVDWLTGEKTPRIC